MLNNQQQMDLLKQAVREDYKGSIADLMEGIPPEGQQENVEVAETPQAQEQGLSGRAPQQLPDAMVFPNSQGDFNTNNMQAPIDIDKYGRQGELVQSYKSVPPGVGNLPMGDDVGTVIERPSEYQSKGVKELPVDLRLPTPSLAQDPNINIHSDFGGVNISNIPTNFGTVGIGGRLPHHSPGGEKIGGSLEGRITIPINKKKGGFFKDVEVKTRKKGGFFNCK